MHFINWSWFWIEQIHKAFERAVVIIIEESCNKILFFWKQIYNWSVCNVQNCYIFCIFLHKVCFFFSSLFYRSLCIFCSNCLLIRLLRKVHANYSIFRYDLRFEFWITNNLIHKICTVNVIAFHSNNYHNILIFFVCSFCCFINIIITAVSVNLRVSAADKKHCSTCKQNCKNSF